MAKTRSIKSKVEILTCKNYSFHGDRIDFETMAERCPESDDKELRELRKMQEMLTPKKVQGPGSLEPNGLRVMLASLNHHLKEAGSNISIAKDREFKLLTAAKYSKVKLVSFVSKVTANVPKRPKH